ncbi:MAG: PHP domain-containing protein, partial [Microbacteriaceae bacterium]|nr:PHP domain-containing protein [Microbacteriaceae bacterium]
MGFHNPAITWGDMVATLEGRPPKRRGGADEREAPASRKRKGYVPPPIVRPADAVPYAELHAHSSYSFLDGVSDPARLVEEAERLGLTALALTDHDGYYGVARFAEAAEALTVATVFGSELSLGLPGPQGGEADPAGEHLLLLARGPEGYHRLSGAITSAHLRGGEKGRPVYELDELAALRGHVVALTGCRKGAVRRALDAGGPEAAGAALDRLVGMFGRDGVLVELTDHGDPSDTRRNDVLAGLAGARSLAVVATNAVHYARPDEARLAEAVAAVRANRSLDDLDGWLPSHDGAHLRSGAEMLARFRRYPGAIERTVEVAGELAFELRRHKPALPRVDLPDGRTPMSYLRELVRDAALVRYPELDVEGRERIERELEVIERKGFAGYFLIVRDIVVEAKRLGILCQARGSAAASVVCYLLGITAVDAIKYDLPFERFISTLREEEPDIDVDFDSERREEIIQYVFKKYGRERAAQVCNVIQYRPRNAVRDMARALGYSPGQQDAFAKEIERGAFSADSRIPPLVDRYARALLKAPRHLGIHSGGMVLTERPVGEVVPIEHARMADRTVIQWDKDDAESMGLVKFDLLGLGILAALRRTFDLIEAVTGEPIGFDTIPKEEPEVYEMLCRADAIGVFQVESRAQLSLLPRLQPKAFYDLAIEIALIRPGPIQGGAVHPFVERKTRRDRELREGL